MKNVENKPDKGNLRTFNRWRWTENTRQEAAGAEVYLLLVFVSLTIKKSNKSHKDEDRKKLGRNEAMKDKQNANKEMTIRRR